jgi:soluble lytic murein transglycosylase-like protein
MGKIFKLKPRDRLILLNVSLGMFLIILSNRPGFADPVGFSVQDLLAEARGHSDAKVPAVSHSWHETAMYRLIEYSRKTGLSPAFELPSLRLNSQLLAQRPLDQHVDPLSQAFFRALVYDYYQQPKRLLAVLKQISTDDLSGKAKTLWHRLQLRAYAALKPSSEVAAVVKRLMRSNPEVFNDPEIFQLGLRRMKALPQSAGLVDYLVAVIDEHPGRSILETALRELLTSDVANNYFDYPFLKYLALSRDLFKGDPQRLIQFFKSVHIHRYGRYGADYLRIRLLMRIKEFRPAEDLSRRLLSGSTNDRKKHLQYARLLGQILEKTGRSGEAFELYSSMLDRYGRNRRTRKMWENYARLLGSSSSFGEAAREYGGLARIYSRRHIRWYHFWFLYRAGRYHQALSLVEQARYPEHYSRDRREPMGIYYWQARILERLGRFDEAFDLYKKILSQAASSFYGTLVLGYLDKEVQPARHHIQQKLREWLDAEELTQRAVTEVNFRLDGPASYEAWRSMNERKKAPGYAADIRNLWQSQIDDKSDWALRFPILHSSWLDKVSAHFGADPFLLVSVIRAESRYNPRAVSPVGAQGLMQIMPYTAVKISRELKDSQFRFDDLQNPRLSIVYGSYYLRRLLDYFNNDIVLSLASYNAGPFKTLEWLDRCGMCETDEFIESISYRETRRYVKSILSYYAHYKRIYRHEISPVAIARLPSVISGDQLIY